MESLRSFGNKIMSVLPSVVAVIFIFIIGWLIAKIISYSVSKILRVGKFDAAAEKINAGKYLSKVNINLAPSAIVGKFVYWIILLFVFITASETLGWTAVSTEISKLIGFLPRLFVAIIILILGLYVAGFIRDVIKGITSSLSLSSGKFISNIVFYFLAVTISLTALKQAGIDTSIITSNMFLILGAVLASASISYGFASRDVLSNILAGFYSRNTFTKDMVIEVNGLSGTVTGATNVGLTIREDNGDITVIPMSTLIKHNVRIKNTKAS